MRTEQKRKNYRQRKIDQ